MSNLNYDNSISDLEKLNTFFNNFEQYNLREENQLREIKQILLLTKYLSHKIDNLNKINNERKQMITKMDNLLKSYYVFYLLSNSNII